MAQPRDEPGEEPGEEHARRSTQDGHTGTAVDLAAFEAALGGVQAQRRVVCPGVVALLDLGEQMCLAMADPHVLREQDLNARLMAPAMYAQFAENVKKRKRLESLPYCVAVRGAPGDEPGGAQAGAVQVEIVSGHHRVRVARSVALRAIPIVLDESPLTRSQIAAKQLAHNAIAGFDDPQTLSAIAQVIDNVDDLLESYVGPDLAGALDTLSVPATDAPVVQPQLRLDWHVVSFAFLSHQLAEFTALLDEVAQAKPEVVAVAPMEQFDAFATLLGRYGRAMRIENTSTALALLVETARRQIEQVGGDEAAAPRALAKPDAKPDDLSTPEAPVRTVSVAEVIGRAVLPRDGALRLRSALEALAAARGVGAADRWECLLALAESEAARV